MGRWASETVVLDELERLNDESERQVREYLDLATAAAEAEVTHKSLRANRILRARAEGARSHAEAETIAEADPDVAEAYLDRMVAEAKADACKQTLLTIRNNQDGLRTAVASHRNMFTGPGYQSR